MADPFEYVSKSKLEYRYGYRHAYLGDVPAPVVYGVQGALRENYGVAEGPPAASRGVQVHRDAMLIRQDDLREARALARADGREVSRRKRHLILLP